MKEVLLSVARASIKSHFDKADLDLALIKEEYPTLLAKGACFVTLTQEGRLRGCMGTLHAHRSLLEDIIHNARAAAFSDPRFTPLSAGELASTCIEVSVLSKPEPVSYESVSELRKKLRVGIDGVLIKQGSRQATFLPQVWEELDSFELFFSHLCQKAGLGTECIQEYPEVYTYQVDKIKETC